jgi:hypothetical protein
MLDLYIRYNERLIAESSQDYTTFQTPFSTLRLVMLPMGWTNSVPIFHDDLTFILQAKIPHITIPYIDDVPIKGPKLTYSKAINPSKQFWKTQAFVDLFGNTSKTSTKWFRE